jgi:hypothetical protein
VVPAPCTAKQAKVPENAPLPAAAFPAFRKTPRYPQQLFRRSGKLPAISGTLSGTPESFLPAAAGFPEQRKQYARRQLIFR